MRAAVVTPGLAGSGRIEDVPDPEPRNGEVLIQVHQVGLDGTDAEIFRGEYGEAPANDDFLIVGHESLGRVAEVDAAAGSLSPGDWVVAIVRRPDPVPCRNCAAGEWDMCLNGRYTERGIKGRHGFLSEYYVELPEYLVRVPAELSSIAVLLEPLSVVEKAIEHIRSIQSRMVWRPERALVLGAGPIGLLAAMLLALDGTEVHIYDAAEPGFKAELAKAFGARYIWADAHEVGHELATTIGPIDIAIEATGFSPLAFDAADMVGANGIVCLTGVSGGSRKSEVSADHLNLEMVLSNKVVFGTVNANRRHYESGVRHLQSIERRWPGLLSRLITNRLQLNEVPGAFERSASMVKSIVEIAG